MKQMTARLVNTVFALSIWRDCRPTYRVIKVVGLYLLLLNSYGLTQSLRPDNITLDNLRFKERDVTLSEQEFRNGIIRLPEESDFDYSGRLTKVIANGIAHVHWDEYDPSRFHQTVPVWENYLLWMMGVLKVTPEYERYHFSNIDKSIERGIGICGDASILMSQLLDKNGIKNQIVTIPGHVIVEAEFDDGKRVLDPDFGVVLQNSAAYYHANPEHIGTQYSDVGHDVGDNKVIENRFRKNVTYWNGVEHFITKKYYFEKAAYLVKWLLPIMLIAVSIGFGRRTKVLN